MPQLSLIFIDEYMMLILFTLRDCAVNTTADNYAKSPVFRALGVKSACCCCSANANPNGLESNVVVMRSFFQLIYLSNKNHLLMGSVKAANTHFSEAETSKSLMSYSA